MPLRRGFVYSIRRTQGPSATRAGGPEHVKTRTAWAPVVGVTIALILLATACGSSNGTAGSSGGAAGRSDQIGDEGAPVDGGTLVVAVDGESSGWNPAIDRWAPAGALVGSSVLEPLATLDGDAVAQPWLATSWTPSENYDVWTIKLREGVVFHDGTPFDANAVKANLDFIVDAPLSGVAMKPLFDHVVVVDDHTVEVYLKSRWAAFPSSFLAGQSAFMRSPDSMLADDKGSGHPVGTGPFVFQSWTPDVSFKATANRQYWRPGEPHLDAIEYRPIPDPTSRAAALESGDVDMAFINSPTDASRLDPNFTVLRNWDVTPQALLTNVRPTANGDFNPMSNIHARLAMAHAIDRDALAASIGQGVEVPTSPFSPDNPWGQPSDQNRYPDYNSDAARQELDAYRNDTGQDALESDDRRNERHRRVDDPSARATAARRRGYRRQGRRARPVGAHQRGRRRALSGRDVRELQLARPGPEPLLLVGLDREWRRRRQHQLHRVHERHHGTAR